MESAINVCLITPELLSLFMTSSLNMHTSLYPSIHPPIHSTIHPISECGDSFCTPNRCMCILGTGHSGCWGLGMGMVIPESSPVKAWHQEIVTVTHPHNAGSTGPLGPWAFLLGYTCRERLLVRCDGNAGNSFPTSQGKSLLFALLSAPFGLQQLRGWRHCTPSSVAGLWWQRAVGQAFPVQSWSCVWVLGYYFSPASVFSPAKWE